MKEEIQSNQPRAERRRKLLKSYKSNTHVYDDYSIEVVPQTTGTPAQREVRKVGRSKRYLTRGRNPLTCIELKCPNEVVDKADYFFRELEALTRDIQIREPELPEGEWLLDGDSLKLYQNRTDGSITAWLHLKAGESQEMINELYNLIGYIVLCITFQTSTTPKRA